MRSAIKFSLRLPSQITPLRSVVRLWNLNICIENVDAKCWLAHMTSLMTSLPLAHIFLCSFFTFALLYASHWLAEIWQLRNMFQEICPILRFDLDMALKKRHKKWCNVHHQRKHNVTWEQKGLNATTSGAKFPAPTLRGWLHWYRTGFCATVWCSVNRCSYYTR